MQNIALLQSEHIHTFSLLKGYKLEMFSTNAQFLHLNHYTNSKLVSDYSFERWTSLSILLDFAYLNPQ